MAKLDLIEEKKGRRAEWSVSSDLRRERGKTWKAGLAGKASLWATSEQQDTQEGGLNAGAIETCDVKTT